MIQRIRNYNWRGAARSSFTSVLSVVLITPVLITFNRHVASLVYVQGESMYPHFNEDFNRSTKPDWILNWRWKPSENLRRGMIVTFVSPNRPEVESIKRITALEGDRVQPAKEGMPAMTVPQGHVWLEGDGPEHKVIDSNTYGPVSASMITGKLVWQISPLRKFGHINWQRP